MVILAVVIVVPSATKRKAKRSPTRCAIARIADVVPARRWSVGPCIKNVRSKLQKARRRSTIHRSMAGGIFVPIAEQACFTPIPRYSLALLISRVGLMMTPMPFLRARIFKSRNVSVGWRACKSCLRLSVTRRSSDGTRSQGSHADQLLGS